MRDEMMDEATIKKVLGDVERMLRAGSPEVRYDCKSVNVTSYSEPWERQEFIRRPTLTISGEVPPASRQVESPPEKEALDRLCLARLTWPHYLDFVKRYGYAPPWLESKVNSVTGCYPTPYDDVLLGDHLLSKEGAPVKKQNLHKFYVSRSPMVTPVESYLRLKDAVGGAQRLVAMTGDKYVVLQMVRVVHRKPQPIVVEQP